MNDISTAESNWSDWVGKQQSQTDVISAQRVRDLAATLGHPQPAKAAALPPGWHWIFFNSFVPRAEVGADGHPKRGGFLPPVPLPRRMWAGGRIEYLAPLPLGCEATKLSEILKVETKSGRRGSLVFVTVRHTLGFGSKTCIVEEQDIVYREAAQPGAPAPALEPAPMAANWGFEVVPDPVLLFRYSALTSNGHRIHYDRDYARNEEAYRDLVVHGPLLATFLQDLARSARPAVRLRQFSFRGLGPVFVDGPFHVEAKAAAQDNELALWIRDANGGQAMQASAVFD
ncbi:FAS1-like dehydratase domain-containing protein [Bosea thiooxidans]